MADDFNPESENKTLNHIIKGNNLTTSNTLLHFACLDYIENYKSNLVPFNYIEYFIKYVSNYEKLFESDLLAFYNNFDLSNMDLELLATIYSKDTVSIVVTVVTKDSIEFIVTDENPVDLLSYYMESETRDTTQKRIYNNLKRIIDEMNKSDELVSKKSLYEKYMINKFLDNYTPQNVIKSKKQPKTNNEASIQSVNTDEKQENLIQNVTPEDKDLRGKEIDVPNQKGKVVKLFIPKLPLPSPYPILQDTSRINSDYRTTKLLKADSMLSIFGKHKFKAVIYSTGFIGKRKKVKKPKPKFSFDF